MKSWTIAQRLYAFFGIVTLALAAGFRLYVYAAHLEEVAVEQGYQIETSAAVIRFDALQISDSLRALVLDPTSQAERQRRISADAHLTKTIDNLKSFFTDQPELIQAANEIRDFDNARLAQAEAQILQLVGTNRAAAASFYTDTYLPLRRQQERLLEAFRSLTEKELTGRIADARLKRVVALGNFGVIFVGAVIALLFFARALTRPVQELSAAVGILAGGDLSARLPQARGRDEISLLTISFGRLVSSLRSFSDAANRVAAGDLTAEFKPQSERDVMGNTLAEMARKLSALVTEVQKIYSQNFFPEMKADWRAYPENIGHKNWPGCFRCHDGTHKTADKKQAIPASDCSSCHTFLAQGAGAELEKLSAHGDTFTHIDAPYSDFDCARCHTGAFPKE